MGRPASDAAAVQAYVFWHEPARGVAVEEYEAALRAFHDRLEATRPTGLQLAVSYRTESSPFEGRRASEPCYEDWYILASTASLDAVETAAVSRAAAASHDSIARLAGRGAGGLYRLRPGPIDPSVGALVSSTAGVDPLPVNSLTDLPAAAAAPRDVCAWADRPRGIATKDAVDALREATGARLIWQRRLALGPGSEFIVWSSAAAGGLPAGWSIEAVRRTRIAASAGASVNAR